MQENRGGAREGAGRKPKATEIQLIERLSPLDDLALDTLKMRIAEGDMAAVKLFFEYRYGKPKQDIGVSGEMSLIWNEIKKYESK
ncbi:MAG: hypothetical protein WC380_00205 [Pedobacter sp.]|jgi:hypothetical protein